jgi:quercetin dioxygenase-like cupin family protein
MESKVKMMRKTQLWKRHCILSVSSVLLLAGLLVCSVSGIISSSGTALATPNSGFFSTVVGPTRFDDIDVKTHTEDHKVQIKVKGLSDVYIVTNRVVPGGHSGWHTHPGPSVVSVKSGTATVYDGDDPTCTPQIYHAGTGFVDPGGGHVHLVRNEGSVDLELVAFQVIPLGAQRRIDAPSPGNCPF